MIHELNVIRVITFRYLKITRICFTYLYIVWDVFKIMLERVRPMTLSPRKVPTILAFCFTLGGQEHGLKSWSHWCFRYSDSLTSRLHYHPGNTRCKMEWNVEHGRFSSLKCWVESPKSKMAKPRHSAKHCANKALQVAKCFVQFLPFFWFHKMTNFYMR